MCRFSDQYIEMLRFSAIMEQVLAKIEPLRAQADQAIQADSVESEETPVSFLLALFW